MLRITHAPPDREGVKERRERKGKGEGRRK